MEQVGHIFRDSSVMTFVPIEILNSCFDVLKNNSNEGKRRDGLFGFHEWLNAVSQCDPEQALTATEIYLDYVFHCKPYLFDHENSLAKLMTRLFVEAEEREESDSGETLRRVVAVQDALLSLGVSGISDWLKAAERP
jgi:hypothetical protein